MACLFFKSYAKLHKYQTVNQFAPKFHELMCFVFALYKSVAFKPVTIKTVDERAAFMSQIEYCDVETIKNLLYSICYDIDGQRIRLNA